MEKICSFCNVSSKDGRRIFPNEKENSFICEYCVDAAYEVLHGGENAENLTQKENISEINYDDIKLLTRSVNINRLKNNPLKLTDNDIEIIYTKLFDRIEKSKKYGNKKILKNDKF